VGGAAGSGDFFFSRDGGGTRVGGREGAAEIERAHAWGGGGLFVCARARDTYVRCRLNVCVCVCVCGVCSCVGVCRATEDD